MTHGEKVKFLKVSLAMQEIGTSLQIADQIVQTYEKMLVLGGKFSVSDAVDIEIGVERKYKKKAQNAKK